MAIIYIGFPMIFATGSLSLIKLCALIILLSTLIGVIIHLITLEVELDASFNRAFPIIKKKYLKCITIPVVQFLELQLSLMLLVYLKI